MLLFLGCSIWRGYFGIIMDKRVLCWRKKMNFMISKVATSCAVFASVVFGVALTANAADRNWIGGQPDVANTPESPYTIQDLANWDGSGDTRNDSLYLSVTEKTYIQSTNDTVRLGNAFCPNSGEFVFTGSMLNFQLKAGYVADSTVSILKKIGRLDILPYL